MQALRVSLLPMMEIPATLPPLFPPLLLVHLQCRVQCVPLPMMESPAAPMSARHLSLASTHPPHCFLFTYNAGSSVLPHSLTLFRALPLVHLQCGVQRVPTAHDGSPATLPPLFRALPLVHLQRGVQCVPAAHDAEPRGAYVGALPVDAALGAGGLGRDGASDRRLLDAERPRNARLHRRRLVALRPHQLLRLQSGLNSVTVKS